MRRLSDELFDRFDGREGRLFREGSIRVYERKVSRGNLIVLTEALHPDTSKEGKSEPVIEGVPRRSPRPNRVLKLPPSPSFPSEAIVSLFVLFCSSDKASKPVTDMVRRISKIPRVIPDVYTRELRIGDRFGPARVQDYIGHHRLNILGLRGLVSVFVSQVDSQTRSNLGQDMGVLFGPLPGRSIGLLVLSRFTHNLGGPKGSVGTGYRPR
ncbi:hypothetical protein CRG98_029935 [Punica granatum]|uniref:Uncharacterized protein n=1 Tax=Punica granatum TaxID=22663 RepID=A0A2I0J178_PUNGR|nr:hypothetical protein CRG98_029935 [Punica granatum]